MNLTLFVVVLITAILLVVIAMSIARAISPRTFNKQKGEAYECGVPTRGKPMNVACLREENHGCSSR